MICNIFDMVISISFIYFLLPNFGAIGYIIVMYISETLNYIISVNTLFKTADIKFKYFEWFIFPVICIILSLFIVHFFTVPLIMKLTLVILIYLFLLTIEI